MTRRNRRERRPPAPPVDDPPVKGSVSPPDASLPPSRRAFLWKTWVGLAGIAMVELIWVVADFLKPRRRDVATSDAVIVAGPVDRFAPASVTAFPAGRFYLVRTDEGGFLAVSRECTHLGCTVPWSAEENQFVCPCHGSAFDLRGDVVNPPAPRALDLFEVRIENRVVKVNTANVRRRNSFELRQVTWA